jgi:hypothetical protein
VTYTGFATGEGSSALGGALTYGGSSQGARNVSSSYYVIAPSGYTSGNYDISYGNGGLTISLAALTITAATNSKTYDGTTSAAATPTYNGLQAGDTLIGLIETYDNKNAGTGKTLTVNGYTLSDGNSGNNYTVNLVNDITGVITKASLTAITGITADNKVYDATTAATLNTGGAGFTGIVNGDALGVATATGAFDTPFAGTGKRVRILGITLSGADAANYNLLDSTATTYADIISIGNGPSAALMAAVVANTSTVFMTANDTSRIDVTQSPESATLSKTSLGLPLWKFKIIDDGLLLPKGVKAVPAQIVNEEPVFPVKI